MKKFEQMKRLFYSIKAYANPNDYSDEMISGLTADFDRLFELSWKTLKEYMYTELAIRDAKTGSPKEILKLAYKQGLIQNEDFWLSMLKDRNDDTHQYLHPSAMLYMSRILESYLPFMESFIHSLEELIPNEELPEDRPPASFFKAWKQSGKPMGDFIRGIQRKYGLETEEEVIRRWEEITANQVI